MCSGFLVQFLLGLSVSLFVTIPRDHPGANPREYFGGVVHRVTWAVLQEPLLLLLHAAFGLALVVAASIFLVQAARSGPRSLAWAAGAGAFSELIAGFNGGRFLDYNEDFSSMIMAGFFPIAIGARAVALFIRPGETAPSAAGLGGALRRTMEPRCGGRSGSSA